MKYACSILLLALSIMNHVLSFQCFLDASIETCLQWTKDIMIQFVFILWKQFVILWHWYCIVWFVHTLETLNRYEMFSSVFLWLIKQAKFVDVFYIDENLFLLLLIDYIQGNIFFKYLVINKCQVHGYVRNNKWSITSYLWRKWSLTSHYKFRPF